MDDREAIEVMQRSSEEIKILRAEINRLRPRAEAFDALQTVLGMVPRQPQVCGEDWAWRLDKMADELRAVSPPASEVKAALGDQ